MRDKKLEQEAGLNKKLFKDHPFYQHFMNKVKKQRQCNRCRNNFTSDGFANRFCGACNAYISKFVVEKFK